MKDIKMKFVSEIKKYKYKILTGIFFFGAFLLFVGINTKSVAGSTIAAWTGLTIMTPYIVYFSRARSGRSNQNEKENEKRLINFKNRAEKIKVSVTHYSIKSNSWTEEVNVGGSRSVLLNHVSGNSDKNIRLEKRFSNVITLKIKYLDKTETYDIASDKSPEILRMLLELKKETILYIDPKDAEQKYLDLEFLE